MRNLIKPIAVVAAMLMAGVASAATDTYSSNPGFRQQSQDWTSASVINVVKNPKHKTTYIVTVLLDMSYETDIPVKHHVDYHPQRKIATNQKFIVGQDIWFIDTSVTDHIFTLSATPNPLPFE